MTEQNSEYTNALLRRTQVARRVAEGIQRTAAEGKSFSCVLIEIDNFGQLRESVGAEAAAALLGEVLALLQQAVPEGANAEGYGREQFVLLLPGWETEQALLLADRLRSQVSDHEFSVQLHGRPRSAPLTVSAGIASGRRATIDQTELLRRAGEALYKAKRAGGNQVSLPPEEGLILKSNYYSATQLEKLSLLAERLERSEASVLREALDDALAKYNI